MARVVTKKSTVPGKVPLAADLEIGELAVNTADAKLFTKHSDNTIKQLGGDAASSYFRTEPIAATASGQTSFTVPGGYTPGAIFVSLNGAALPPADYTATDGATVVLASGSGIVAGSVLLVHVFSAFEVADALPLGGTAADSSKLGGQLPALYLNDMLAQLTAAEIFITSATSLSSTAFGRMHVCSSAVADFSVNLPAALGNAGRIIGIRMAPALSKFVTLVAADSDLIDGQAARVMWANESAVLLCTGTGWTKIAGNTVPVSCVAYASANQTLSPSVVTAVPLRSVASDPAGLHDATNGRINIKRPGAYIFSGAVYLQSVPVGTLVYTQTRVHFNGGMVSGGTAINTTQVPPNAVSFNPITTTVNLQSTGYVELVGYFDNTSGASHTTYSGTVDFTSLKIAELPSW